MTRRSFHHESVEVRRQDLIAATLDAIAESGIQGATVREIADRAGVTPGLIRHYFVSKELMFQAAYRAIMNTMFETANDAAEELGTDAVSRLRIFVIANFKPPIIDPRNLSLWATFISQITVDEALAAIHREGYLAFRDKLEAHIGAALEETGRKLAPGELRYLAIAINGLMDGLWLEGSMAADMFGEGELAHVALSSVERLLGISLAEKK
ncbi:TetR family transcriptional regulator C-terminal domain-containing protein [Rhizobium sp. TH2]|uniref:TetR family transcriptional regulator C-terminal domain-containing protein n=1 Tax=Rhizobium sp. TH2 TaxID=2775403 RepID=UPI0021588B41|nr:TetR family transcriptional regulator C-terminal domain-containing protein [Rhizobium sp. TH2]UVC08783.1 TetR family transcriptional regulator C-terminal domain-containing protein [Rhizobium sp. TH2]